MIDRPRFLPQETMELSPTVWEVAGSLLRLCDDDPNMPVSEMQLLATAAELIYTMFVVRQHQDERTIVFNNGRTLSIERDKSFA